MKQKKWNILYFYIPLLILMTISVFVMYHARNINAIYKNHYIKQLLFFLLGFSLILIKDKVKIKWLFNYSSIFYILNNILLIAVLFLGESTNGAKAWFDLGFISFQPSELMKLTLCLFLTHITQKQIWKKKTDHVLYLLKVAIIVLIPSILVFLEPDTGAIIFYLLIALAISLTTPIPKKWFLIISTLLISCIGLFFYAYYFKQETLIKILGTSFFYRVERLLNFQQGLQIDNALITLGSAPLFQFNLNNPGLYIPEAPTDFAFSLTANVFGIIGNITILLCLLLINTYLINLWKNKKSQEEKTFLLGFLLMFLFNQFYNIFMNIGLIPIMGIPLPFLSYGGSTTIVYFCFLAISLKKTKIK